MALKAENPPSLEQLRSVFNDIDRDGSGQIEFSDVKIAFRQMHPDAKISDVCFFPLGFFFVVQVC
jgi:hypothetical protein